MIPLLPTVQITGNIPMHFTVASIKKLTPRVLCNFMKKSCVPISVCSSARNCLAAYSGSGMMGEGKHSGGVTSHTYALPTVADCSTSSTKLSRQESMMGNLLLGIAIHAMKQVRRGYLLGGELTPLWACPLQSNIKKTLVSLRDCKQTFKYFSITR